MWEEVAAATTRSDRELPTKFTLEALICCSWSWVSKVLPISPTPMTATDVRELIMHSLGLTETNPRKQSRNRPGRRKERCISTREVQTRRLSLGINVVKEKKNNNNNRTSGLYEKGLNSRPLLFVVQLRSAPPPSLLLQQSIQLGWDSNAKIYCGPLITIHSLITIPCVVIHNTGAANLWLSTLRRMRQLWVTSMRTEHRF